MLAGASRESSSGDDNISAGDTDAELEGTLWRRAYDLERERSVLLRLVSGDVAELQLQETEVPIDPPGGWKLALAALRAENAAVEQFRRDRLVAAAAAAKAADLAVENEVPAVVEVTENTSVEATVKDDEEEPPLKVYSLFNLPSDDIEDETLRAGIDLVTVTDLPPLAALFGIEASDSRMPSISCVREELGLDTAETGAVVCFQGAREYGGRVYEFRGKLIKDSGSPYPPDAASERLETLLLQLQRQARERLTVDIELFLLPGRKQPELVVDSEDGDDDVLLFAFCRDDLPCFQPSESTDLVASILATTAAVFCNAETLAALIAAPGSIFPGELIGAGLIDMELAPDLLVLWLLGPLLLLTLLAAFTTRREVAKLYGLQISQLPLPSLTAGHLGSVWSPHGFLPSQRANFDIAVAGPAVSLLISFAVTAIGVSHVRDLNPADAPLQVPALDLPVLLVGLLGYKFPVTGEEPPLLTLAAPDFPSLGPGPEGPLVPVDVFLLGGAIGLAAASVNMLPIGGFDGYAVARAAFGQKITAVLELVSLGALCIEVGRDDIRGVFASEVVLVWMLQWLVGNRRDEAMPPKESVSPLGPDRQVLAAALLAVSAAVLQPPP